MRVTCMLSFLTRSKRPILILHRTSKHNSKRTMHNNPMINGM